MFALLAVLAPGGTANADTAGTMTDRCVQTKVWRDGMKITGISIYNVCGYTLGMVDGHAYNTSAGIDERSGAPVDLRAGTAFSFGPMGGYPYPAASGSWTCGEIWGPGAFLYGRDCVQM